MATTNKTEPGPAVLYARVSSDDQVHGYSLNQQIEALEVYCAREGYEILEKVRDEGWSGAYLERPGLDRVRDLVEAGGVGVVLAQDADRITRDPGHRAFLDDDFERLGTRLVALDDWGDDTHEGELLKFLKGWVSKGERLKIAERSRRGMLRKAREGKVILPPIPDFGFEANTTRDGYVVNEEKMALVRRIFSMVGVEAYPINRVVKTLAAEGILTPKRKRRWSRTMIRNMIKDDAYKPHTHSEMEDLLSPDIASRLAPDECYGVWWFNRRRVSLTQVVRRAAMDGGRTYRKVTKGRPPGRDEPDWAAKIHVATAPVYYHNYVLGNLIAAQLKNYLETHITRGPFYENEVAGRYLLESFFGPGARENWRDTVLRATGAPLDPQHFVGSLK